MMLLTSAWARTVVLGGASLVLTSAASACGGECCACTVICASGGQIPVCVDCVETSEECQAKVDEVGKDSFCGTDDVHSMQAQDCSPGACD